MDGLFGFFEERETGAFVFGHLISLRKGFHSSRAGFGGEIVEGNSLATPQGLLAAVKDVSFSVLLACCAEWHFVYLLGLAPMGCFL